ncbi:MAG: hypothetical protein ACNA8L_00690 [Luteolibacter sp.]|jgi:hypothetical protein
MSPKTQCMLLSAMLLITGMSSCATGNRMVSKVRDFSIADIRPTKIDVVEVREKDLKPLPTGEERLLAYQRSGRFFGWFGPAIFREPDLPAEGLPMDGGLLPNLD